MEETIKTKIITLGSLIITLIFLLWSYRITTPLYFVSYNYPKIIIINIIGIFAGIITMTKSIRIYKNQSKIIGIILVFLVILPLIYFALIIGEVIRNLIYIIFTGQPITGGVP